MRFIKTAYRSIQARFAAFMWAHADESFVRCCIEDCVELIDIDEMHKEISERIVDVVDLEDIARDVRHTLIENTDIETDEIAQAIAENISTNDIESEVAAHVIEDISASQISDEIVETVGDEIKDDCIEQIMEQIESQRDGWAELLVQRMLQNPQFIAALAGELLRTNKETTDATA